MRIQKTSENLRKFERKIIFFTFAYNAEKTIRRTIESVINQKYSNWIYYIVDNNSADSTLDIIKDFSEKDARIIARKNKENRVWEKGNNWYEIIWEHSEDDYFCFIDADDEYKPNFLEKLCPFAQEHNLDIAVCGNDHIDISTGELTWTRKLSENLILENESFGTDFPTYFPYMRTYWAKLFKISVLRKADFALTPDVGIFGADTIFVVGNFRNAGRVGIYAESFHKWYINNTQSASRKWDDVRINTAKNAHNFVKKYVLDKAGFISPENNEFLLSVYFNTIKETMINLSETQMSDREKADIYRQIMTSKETKELANFTFTKYRSLNKDKKALLENFYGK